MSRVEVLMSCMNQDDKSIATHTNINSDVLIINQCDKSYVSIIEKPFGTIRMISTTQKGVSNSRNLAVKNSHGTYCLFCDDDEVLADTYPTIIESAFKENPKCDVLCFKVIFGNKKYWLNEKNIGYLRALKIGSWQIAFKSQTIKDNYIIFDNQIGSGSGNGGGEENKFLYDCLRKGLKIRYIPTLIATVAQQEISHWFHGYDEQFFFKRGISTTCIMGHFPAFLYSIYYTIAKYKKYKNSLSIPKVLFLMSKGIINYNKEMEKYNYKQSNPLADKILRKLQLTEVEILDEIVRICNKHNIQYFLSSGTLLGAIRHKGFIPWDDDIDITMPRKDYEKFREICCSELDDKYSLVDHITNPSHHLALTKIQKNDTIFETQFTKNLNTSQRISVDIFILDNANRKYSLFIYLKGKLCKILSSMLWVKVVCKSYDKKTFKQKIGLFMTLPFNPSFLSRLMHKIMSSNKDENSKFFVNLTNRYKFKNYIIPKNKYLPATKVEFEGKLYNAPKEWDYILTLFYDEYMKLPHIKMRSLPHSPIRVEFF